MDYYDYINELIPDAPEWAVSQLAVDMADLARKQAETRTGARDGFAARALEGILASGPNMSRPDPTGVAKTAYKYADAMMEARKEGGE